MKNEELCKIMLDFMEGNPELAKGTVKSASNPVEKTKKLKESFAAAINSLGGKPKSATEAYNCWSRWKSDVLKKQAMDKAFSDITGGGGSPSQIEFSDLENRLLTFLGPDACGLSGVKQGGLPYGKYSLVNTPIVGKVTGSRQQAPKTHGEKRKYEDEYERRNLALKRESLKLEKEKLEFNRRQLGL